MNWGSSPMVFPSHPEMVKRLSAFSKLKKMKSFLRGLPMPRSTNPFVPDGPLRRWSGSLSALKKRSDSKSILMFTVMKRNYRDLPSLLTLCQNLGLNGFILERFVPWGRGREIEEEVLSKDQWKEVVKILLHFISADAEEDPFLPYQAFQVQFDRKRTGTSGCPLRRGTGWALHHARWGGLPLQKIPRFHR